MTRLEGLKKSKSSRFNLVLILSKYLSGVGLESLKDAPPQP